MMNRIPKKAYTTEFKELAVKRVSDGEAISVVVRELGLSDQTLRNWIKASSEGKLKGAGTKVVTPEAMELSRLRAEVARLKRENEIIKKAAAYFAAGRFHYSAIGRKGFACAVFFDGAGANCRIPNLIENEVVEVKLAKIKTLIGDISYLLSMSANGQIIYEKIPSQALQEWKDGSNQKIYVNSFALILTIGFFGYLISAIFSKDR